MKSDDIKATVKIERSPPVFPEAVGSRGEMTPDEFYAQSLRLDFPRSTLGKIRKSRKKSISSEYFGHNVRFHKPIQMQLLIHDESFSSVRLQ